MRHKNKNKIKNKNKNKIKNKNKNKIEMIKYIIIAYHL
jgi:hypothetical protein